MLDWCGLSPSTPLLPPLLIPPSSPYTSPPLPIPPIPSPPSHPLLSPPLPPLPIPPIPSPPIPSSPLPSSALLHCQLEARHTEDAVRTSSKALHLAKKAAPHRTAEIVRILVRWGHTVACTPPTHTPLTQPHTRAHHALQCPFIHASVCAHR